MYSDKSFLCSALFYAAIHGIRCIFFAQLADDVLHRYQHPVTHSVLGSKIGPRALCEGAARDGGGRTARASGFAPFSIRETQHESCWRSRFVFCGGLVQDGVNGRGTRTRRVAIS